MGAQHDITSAGTVCALALSVDAHVHTGFAAGRDSVGVIVSAADRAGLRTVTFADQVGPDTTWLPAYADAIRRARKRSLHGHGHGANVSAPELLAGELERFLLRERK